MSKVSERDAASKLYVSAKIDVAKNNLEGNFSEFDAESIVYLMLSDLIEVQTKGFRGIVVTALTGLYIDDSYDPLNDFYACNPRAIFENGIFYALQENNIPCGKSDPLNVAKNINRLNEDWAMGKRPAKAALAVVGFLRLILEASDRKRERLTDYFFFRLWQYAQKVNDYEVVHVDTALKSKLEVGNRLIAFTLAYPEAGQLPQFLVSKLLQVIFRCSAIAVVGGEESVFGTNTTSKKPVDVWLEEDGEPTNLYEVTVKKVTLKRLNDSVDALRKTRHLNCAVTFICRLPEDISELASVSNHFTYQNKRFEFIDYRAFCLSLFVLLSNSDVEEVLERTSELVKNVNTSLKTKNGWNELFGDM